MTHAKVRLGLQPLVRDEEEVSSIIRASTALPLLPAEEIEEGLNDLGYEALQRGWMQHLRPFFNYMDTEWMPKVEVLSVFKAAHRTNNVAGMSVPLEGDTLIILPKKIQTMLYCF